MSCWCRSFYKQAASVCQRRGAQFASEFFVSRVPSFLFLFCRPRTASVANSHNNEEKCKLWLASERWEPVRGHAGIGGKNTTDIRDEMSGKYDTGTRKCSTLGRMGSNEVGRRGCCRTWKPKQRDMTVARAHTHTHTRRSIADSSCREQIIWGNWCKNAYRQAHDRNEMNKLLRLAFDGTNMIPLFTRHLSFLILQGKKQFWRIPKHKTLCRKLDKAKTSAERKQLPI